MTRIEPSEMPSHAELLRATAIALVVAAVVLVSFVLPAEYGLDPTGVGTRLGLLRHPVAAETPAPVGPSVASASSGLLKSPIPFRTDEMTLVLEPGEGAEIKALMGAGERLVFSWAAHGGTVDVDMHGEPAGAAAGQYKSYWKEGAQASGHGAFEAPFAGTHGWFWKNFEFTPVTVTVKTSGFYQKLFRP